LLGLEALFLGASLFIKAPYQAALQRSIFFGMPGVFFCIFLS
ncbi:MAG: hypothetical protein ACJAVK_001833, partial [Akkermansiaceae bacterium]